MFIYYVPNTSQAFLTNGGDTFFPDRLPMRLAGLLGDCSSIPQHVSLAEVRQACGPGGTNGVVIAPVTVEGPPKGVTYRPQNQDWMPVGNPESPLYWVGVNRDQLPTPQTLVRRNVIPGGSVTDEAGRVWQIPIIRAKWDKYGTLPQYFEFDDLTGAPVSMLKDDQRGLWELGNKIWSWYNDRSAAAGEGADPSLPDDQQPAKPESPDFSWLTKAALTILGVNYRVSGPELRMLRTIGGPVLSQEAILGITQVAIGFDLLAESEKKSGESLTILVPSGSNSPLGESTPPECPGTDPATPPCISPPDSTTASAPTKSITTSTAKDVVRDVVSEEAYMIGTGDY